jgi:hypothetical protein
MSGAHCKTPDHLSVSVGRTLTRATRLHDVRAFYVDPLGCRDEQCYGGPGIVLAKDAEATNGMHLMPAAIDWLPGQLRECALQAGSNGFVTLSHTISGDWKAYKSFTSGAALALADEIEHAWAVRR